MMTAESSLLDEANEAGADLDRLVLDDPVEWPVIRIWSLKACIAQCTQIVSSGFLKFIPGVIQADVNAVTGRASVKWSVTAKYVIQIALTIE